MIRFSALLLCCFLWVSYNKSYGQSEYQFKYFSAKDGVVSQGIDDAVQDSLGFIWFNGKTHLFRYDGYTFKRYTHNREDSLSWANDMDAQLLTDRLGKLWYYSGFYQRGDGSLFQYDSRTDGFIRHNIGIGPRIRAICFDKKDSNRIWLGCTLGLGLYAYDVQEHKVLNYINNGTDSVDTPRSRRNSIFGIQDRDSVLLLATGRGLWHFNKASGVFSRPPIPVKDSTFFFNTGFGIPKEDEENKWIRMGRNLYWLDDHYNVKEVVPVTPQGIMTTVRSFDTDTRGRIWFANREGIHRYDTRVGEFTNIFDPDNKGDSWMWNVSADRDDGIWAMPTGGGLLKLKEKVIETYTSFESTVGRPNIIQTENGEKLILPGDKGALYSALLKKGRLDFQSINYVGKENVRNNFNGTFRGKEYFWLTIWNEGIMGIELSPAGDLNYKKTKFIQHDPQNPYTISSNQSFDVLEDGNNKLWLASQRGLSEINLSIQYGVEGSVTRHIHDPNNTNSIGHNEVRTLAKESDDFIWVTNIQGLDLFDGSKFIHQFPAKEGTSKIFKTSTGIYLVGNNNGYFVGEKNGDHLNLERKVLPTGETVTNFTEDRGGRIWMLSSSAVYILDNNLNISIMLDENDGLITNPGYILCSKNDLIIISGPKGISVIDAKAIQVSNHPVFPALTSILVNNKIPGTSNHFVNTDSDFSIPIVISELHELSLDYLHNNFTLEFSAMEMTAPEKNLYRHKLEGYDPDWIETDYKNRTATYTNLPSGTYTFRVKASNHHGVWSDNERTLKVIILPPPWRTWWAYSGYSLIVIGLLVWARSNIVKQERLTASLQLAKVEQEKKHFELEKAKEVDKVKSSFFANISHEFRTPLTLIKGPVQTLLEEFADNPKVKERLKLVQRNSDLLLKLVNQLLDLARLEAGSLKVENTEGDVFSFVRAIAGSFESFAGQKKVSVKIDVPTERCSAFFDKDKVETILINLINNAVKFTPSGGSVKVTTSYRPQATGLSGLNQNGNTARSLAPDAGSLNLSVSDTGIGIPIDQQQKIFERFHQVSEAHKEVGTGIGLALVKELVVLMGGEISVTSEVGVGSEFVVQIPIEMATGLKPLATGRAQPLEVGSFNLHESARSRQPEASGPQDEAKPQVLVVEDNTDLRHFIIESLGIEFNFLEAENGKIGLEIAKNEIPDLIISDVMMPEMDGITMAGKIKTDIRTSHIPLILLTAKSSEDSKLSGLSSGADDYLTKPFNKNELLLKVRNGVNRQLKLRERLRAELMSNAPKVEVLSEDEKFLNSVKEKILERLSDEQLSVESLADDMGMSRVQLYRKVSGLTGISVNELIRKLRLQRAAQLLQQNWGPVSQVAYEVGFSNLSYFSKVFKEEFGVLPSEFPRT